MFCIHWHLSLSVFQGERIEKGQGTWDPSEEPPRDVTSLSWLLFSFLFVPETFYKRNGKKKHQCKRRNYYYYCGVTGSTTNTCTTAFFHISILSTDLILVGEWQLLRDYKLKGSGWVGGVQNICFLAFFALFHGLFCLFWIWRGFGRWRKRTQDMSEEVCHTCGPEET